MAADFWVEALEEALAKFGAPEIFNTDQGAQFTGSEFIGVLRDHKIRISMDGKGRWRDNVFVQRLWRSVKYEEVYLHAYESVTARLTGARPIPGPCVNGIRGLLPPTVFRCGSYWRGIWSSTWCAPRNPTTRNRD